MSVPARIATLALTSVLLPALAATAQEGSGDAAEAPTTAPDGTGGSSWRSRPVLLREGSHLGGVRGTLQPGPWIDTWQFVIERERDDEPVHALTLLPCMLLEEMEHLVNASTSHSILFELTGEVQVYRNRNYLLPLHAPHVLAAEDATSTAVAAPEPEPSAPVETAATGGRAEGGDSIAEIIEGLEEAVGPAVRPTETAAPAVDQRLVREGTSVLGRRGRLSRTDAGAWQIIFDADAEGLADPPMLLLPCLLLEHMERNAARAGVNAPVLVSGRVFVYRDQNYLLPTVYRVPQHRTVLHP